MFRNPKRESISCQLKSWLNQEAAIRRTGSATRDEQPAAWKKHKEMRAALVEHVGTSSWVRPAALFELTPAELAALEKRRTEDLTPIEDETEVAASDDEYGGEGGSVANFDGG